jgi:hypothetical protein
MKDKREQELPDQTTYEAVVLVKSSGGENGPGHVSLTFMKSRGESVAPVKRSHSSFFTGGVGSMLTGLSLGSIPVTGIIEKDPQMDFDEATHVLRSKISREQYKEGIKTAENFHADVDTGKNMYAVFGTSNPLSSLMSGLFRHYISVDDNGFSGVSPYTKKNGRTSCS